MLVQLAPCINQPPYQNRIWHRLACLFQRAFTGNADTNVKIQNWSGRRDR